MNIELTTLEQSELARHEAVIERGLKTFYEVGEALAAIRENKLYRAEYVTFGAYCRERWGFGHSYVNYLMDASMVIENLKTSTIVEVLPQTESQARPLTRLTPEIQPVAWQKAVETASNGKVTAAHVEQVVVEIKQSQPMALLASSKNDSWRTPPQYIEAARRVMGAIDLDPASSEVANETVKAFNYFDKEYDGLNREWYGRVWLNPPYGKTNGQSNQGLWAAKLVSEFEAGNVEQAVLLVNMYSGYEWFAPLRTRPMCLVNHRISFIDPETNEEGDEAKASSVFIYFGPLPTMFYKEFSQFGPCGQLNYYGRQNYD